MEQRQATLNYTMRCDAGWDPFPGGTSMSTYPQTPSSQASVFRFLDINLASQAFNRLQQLASVENGNHVVVPKFLHLQEDNTIHLLTEPVTNIREWFENRYNEWNVNFVEESNNSNEERIKKRKEAWWDFIRLKFSVIFRDVIKALQFLKTQKCSIVSVSADIFITTMERAKLFPRVSAMNPVTELHDLIVELIGSRFNSMVSGDDGFFIAGELLEFLHILDPNNLAFIREDFLFECCALFWFDEEKANFIVKLKDLRDNRYLNSLIEIIMNNFNFCSNWINDVPSTGFLRDVFNYAVKHGKPYATSSDIIQFARNAIIHYTSYARNSPLNNRAFVVQQLNSAFPYLFRELALCVIELAKVMKPNMTLLGLNSSKDEILKSLLIDN